MIFIFCLIFFLNFTTIKNIIISFFSNNNLVSKINYKEHGSYIEPALVYIKAGSFTMGGVLGSQRDEQPTLKVTIQNDFYIGQYEVTFAEFDKFCEDMNITKPDDNEWGRGQRPVMNITWEETKAYTLWLSKKTGYNYRLPSEAEWEYAAKAGTTTIYSFGNSSKNLRDYAWYVDNSNKKSQEVGHKKPNPWGLYDMHGNIYEWCEDWYTDNHNSTPVDGSPYMTKTGLKVQKSGAWMDGVFYLRSSNRYRTKTNSRNVTDGFRLVREIIK